MTHRSIDTNTQIIKYINFYRSLNCNRQVNMVYANVSSSRFHYLFISVAELKGPYSVFNFEVYKISFRESLMSLIFPFLFREKSHEFKLCFCIGNIVERNNFGHETKNLFFKNVNVCRQDSNGLLNYGSTSGTFYVHDGPLKTI